MRSRIHYFLFALLVTGLTVASFAAQKEQTFKGEIMDSNCASSGSHAAATKGTNMTATDCTKTCVSHGAKYVLYDETTKTAYTLSDQKKPEQFAGEKVEVTGTLNKSRNTIRVADIKAES